ncbi:MAG: hypothetical protein NTZ80_00200 [Patescibacteria group bacterium]|nr:hypothetical protein [Patescibacteria group bacterium]
MPHFYYYAKNSDGKESSGMIDAVSEDEARVDLAKLGLEITRLETTSTTYKEPRGPVFSFTFKGHKVDGQEIQGTIDAPDSLTAETRLRNEFGLNEITILGQEQVFKKTEDREVNAAEAILRRALDKKKQGIDHAGRPLVQRIFLDVKSFIYWLFFIYALYYFYSKLATFYPLFPPAEIAQETRDSALFVWLLVVLGGLFVILEIPHLVKIWSKINTFIQSVYISSFSWLVLLGIIQSFLMAMRVIQPLPSLYYQWFILLDWPIALLAVIFLISFAVIGRYEKFYLAQ